MYRLSELPKLAGRLKLLDDETTAEVDDVVMGVVSPVGDQGSVIAKVAALKAGWDELAPRATKGEQAEFKEKLKFLKNGSQGDPANV